MWKRRSEVNEAYVQRLVGLVHSTSDYISVFHKYATYGGFVAGQCQLCLTIIIDLDSDNL
jgi:hypothetical protein